MIELATPADTHAFGRGLAELLRAGDLLVLTGPLGAGKTALTQGIGAGLGVRGPVVSPTFVIARVHRGGRLPLVHVDAYRLGSLDEVDDLDLDVEVTDSVTVVEWGAGLVDRLSESRLEVSISRREDTEVRQIFLQPIGGDWAERLAAL
ncbi:MAG: tRNA threonylcarbamoyladenosine biosynthesis protein TsaE [Pseudonocardiales bacterium]|nr:tRNA threonylcarbamoyladenosine biosynthesis protein TsaE [Pseudonocardiales bacterium]MDQ1752968.1 tRNA threonylcarbamoyladenosine biosynthesis protein TsaE [Pseudonocardiales bacterium]